MKASLEKQIQSIAKKARVASFRLVELSSQDKNQALFAIAEALSAQKDFLIKENRKDILLAQKEKYPSALVDRLVLNDKRIDDMVQSLRDTAQLQDPGGEVLSLTKRPNGLKIKKIRVPIGVVAIIFESRPNVTSDCIGLCLKSGNAAVLKGGKEAMHSNQAIFKVCRQALRSTRIPVDAIQLVESIDRRSVEILLRCENEIDLVVPRGGEGLIRFVAEHSRIPVIKHYKGVCHTYVSEHADLTMAQKVCFNAKVQRPGTCNAMEKLLVHQSVAKRFLPPMIAQLQAAHVEIRADRATQKIVKGLKAATLKDWTEEYLDLILTVKVVASVQEAIDHINTFGSHHSDAIITNDHSEQELFFTKVDSACVYANASTRFTDGYEFGFGAEVGISTDKIHARGPMGLEGLTTYKFVVTGQGQIRG